MRTYDEIFDDAREGSPFSNGTTGYGWMDANCDPSVCVHDRDFQLNNAPEGCPLLLAALLGKTPIEWLESPDRIQDYTCIEQRHPDEPGEPEPLPPDPPEQGELFPVPERAVRMLTQPAVLVPA